MSVNLYRLSKTIPIGSIEGRVFLSSKIILDNCNLTVSSLPSNGDYIIAEFDLSTYRSNEGSSLSDTTVWPTYGSGAIWQVSGSDLIKKATGSADNNYVANTNEDNTSLNYSSATVADLTNSQYALLKSYFMDSTQAVALAVTDVYKCNSSTNKTFLNGSKKGSSLVYVAAGTVTPSFTENKFYAFLKVSEVMANLTGANMYLYCWAAIDESIAGPTFVDLGVTAS